MAIRHESKIHDIIASAEKIIKMAKGIYIMEYIIRKCIVNGINNRD